MVAAWSRDSCLGTAEVASCVFGFTQGRGTQCEPKIFVSFCFGC